MKQIGCLRWDLNIKCDRLSTIFGHNTSLFLSSLLTAWCRRPDRQMLLFSATMKKRVENFAREMIRNPIRVAIGTIGHANPDIQQVRRLQ
jgi:superfamily II DNA/RNA helicase